MNKQWKVILGFILVLLIVLFAVFNNQEVPVSFGFTRFYSPLILIIIGSALIGALIVFLTSSTALFRLKKQNKQLHNQIDQYETNNQTALHEEKEAFFRQQENELATVRADYESLLKEKEAEIAELSGNKQPSSDRSIDYFD
ncbi:hypothetical protein NRIC_15410 [Enterococcus florum]|uniref:Lipopolysaccharide assembly protein A domain-containing protein n=1 Tax=Enterococcus florum TaxID=2480627 RepID=A0A4P5P783_9ENTE|nr:lipopolysaccharide assembly protein LapA domain-containing protein [Enterococcus florum]GCF93650.1 hypothetical protein NRIC_15410 [Enterococcus florum]